MRSIGERVGDPAEVLRAFGDKLSREIRVAMPGIIRTYDKAAQTALVRPAVRERVMVEGEVTETDIPDLPDVPVFFPRGGGFCLTYPVRPGDECLLIFADMCVDAWWQSGGVQSQTERRRHDLSDAFAVVGFSSAPNAVKNAPEDAIAMTSGGAGVAVYPDRVEITGRLIINATPYLSHTHGGVEPGGGTTGGVSS